MYRTIVLTSLFLLICSGCSNSTLAVCPKRSPFTGKTWNDLGRYAGSLERLYDSCSGS